MHTIDAFPSINIHTPFQFAQQLPSILRKSNFTFYSSARAALFHVLKSLDIPENGEILYPAFHCGVEVESAVKLKLTPAFYGVNKNLTIDFSDLEKKISTQTKALIVIHYFGFPQNIKKLVELCKQNKIVLIEDCAHSLFSRHNDQFLGTFGTYGVFSLQKTLALPNGGGCLKNEQNLAKPMQGKPFFDRSLVKTTVKSVLDYEMRQNTFSSKIAKQIIRFHKRFSSDQVNNDMESERVTQDWSYDIPRCGYENGIWFFSKILAKGHDAETIIRKRIHNYLLLEKLFLETPDISKVFDHLPPGTCPLCFPVYTSNRDILADTLGSSGIFSYIFGKFLHPLLNSDSFVDAHFLSKNILALPIHQQLSNEDITLLATTINNLRLSPNVHQERQPTP